MVRAVVAELHLHGLRAAREPEQLVAEADAEDRQVGLEQLRGSRRSRSRTAPDRPDRWTGTRHRASSASTSLGGGLRRHHRHAAAAVGEHAQDVALDAEVVGDDVQALVRTRHRRPVLGRPVVPSFHW